MPFYRLTDFFNALPHGASSMKLLRVHSLGGFFILRRRHENRSFF